MSSVPLSRTSGPMLEQLLYMSDSVSGASSGLEMSDILDDARPPNARDGVTGALTVVNGKFVQVIEGPAAALDNLLVRLQRDRRHVRIRILARRPILHRAFGDWDMISPRLAHAEIRSLSALLEGGEGTIDEFIAILAAA
ncbi:MAG: BLUF domain-containing protein, partial [Caulobacteraceae bacterium]